MNYLKFKNQGVITEEAITLLGASSKRTQNNKIGYFGSGNKFALAYLLRNNYEVTIFGGLKEIKVSTTQKKLGEEVFDVIMINDNPTSITTEFGAKWELWQALREIYSNSLDEGEGTIELVNDINPVENESHYYIKVRAEITEWFGNFNNYFAENKEILFENKYGRILKKHDNKGHLYRKGIAVWHNEDDSLYDYDFNNITISEDRIISYTWQISEKIWQLIYSCTDKEIIKNILDKTGSEKYIEGNISSVSDLDSSNVTEEFKDVLKEMRLCSNSMAGYLKEDERLSTTIIPHKVFTSINHLLKDENLGKQFRIGNDGMFYRETEFSPLHRATVNKVIDFLKETESFNILDYDIICGIFDNKNVMGFADIKNQKIVLSDIAVEKGANYTLEVLIEEYIHLKYEVKDETRAFQDAAIQEMVTILKVNNAYVL